MKSGPILKPWTTSPRRRSAVIIASVTVVFPTPLAVPETTIALFMRFYGTVHARRLERRHLPVDPTGGAREMNEERSAGPLAETEAELEIRLELEMRERDRVSGLRRPVRGEERVVRRRRERGRDERGAGGDEAVHGHRH